ncbi:MAG: MarR family transcriptional regulator [Candidatus Omnitrophica bacterium]|nr:MarR family transcriptional regulator [Candidatus Omnitrophota bacterium]
MSELNLDEFGNRMINLIPKLKIELSCYENNSLICADITNTQLFVLECLSACGPCKMNTLVRALKVKFSAATTIMDRLVKTGFVIRERGEEDRRTVFVALSPKGKKIMLEVQHRKRKAFMQVFSRVSAKEREDYLRILEKIVESFSYHAHHSKMN